MRRLSILALTTLASSGCVFGSEAGVGANTDDPPADGTTAEGSSSTHGTTLTTRDDSSGGAEQGGDTTGSDDTTGSTGTPSDDASTGACEPMTWFPDADGDGYGDPDGPSVLSCDPVDMHAANDEDCNDGSAMVSPDLDELCDGIDNDCDLAVDEWSGINASCDDCFAFPGAASIHYVCLGATTWADARDSCELKGAELVRIDDQAENDALTTAAAGLAPGDHWIGLSWSGSEHVWTDGTVVDWENWRPDAPDFSGDCGELDTLDAGQWNDAPCSDTATVVGHLCEGPLQ